MAKSKALVCRLMAFVVVFLFATQAKAFSPTFGAELTFTNMEVSNGDYGDGNVVISYESEDALDDWAASLIKLCFRRGDCDVQNHRDKYGLRIYRVVYKDGWWFQLSSDPGVIEIQTKPTTLRMLENRRDRIQEDIFDTGAQLGLFPSHNDGGGHIHIGAQAVFERRDLLRDFLVDYANHPELAMGILEQDEANAAHLSVLKPKQRKAFAALIESWDKNRVATPQRLAERIVDEVYYEAYFRDWYPSAKYQAVNLSRINDEYFAPEEQTIEMRALRAERSADEYIKLARLFQKRMEYLSKLKERPAYLDNDVPHFIADRVESFRRYVVESGLEWDDYKVFVPKEWLKKHKQKARSCSAILEAG